MKKSLYKLTSSQQSIWLIEQIYSNTNVNNICGIMKFLNPVKFSALEKALNIFIQKNDSFRIKIVLENGLPKQYIDDYSYINFETIELHKSDLTNLANSCINEIFNLTDSQLFKISLVKFEDGSGGFTINMHHLICDAWSMSIVASQVSEIYSDIILEKEIDYTPNPSYIEHIESVEKYMNSNKFIKDKEYWNNNFNDEPVFCSLKLSNNDSYDTMANRKLFTFAEDDTKNIQSYCKDKGISPFSFFMSIISIYMSRVCNSEKVIIGTPVLGRSNFREKNMIGMFVSTIPFQTNVDESLSFEKFVQNLSKEQLTMFRHQKYPYDFLLEDVRKKHSISHNLYDVMLSYQNAQNNSDYSESKYISEWFFNNATSNSLDIHIHDMNNTGLLSICYDYKISCFTEKEIDLLHKRFIHMISQIFSNKCTSLKDIEIILPYEKHKLLIDFNNTKGDYPKDKTICELFEKQVLETPNNIAITLDDDSLTYNELNQKCNQLAHFLVSKGAQPNENIALKVDKTFEMVIGTIAILKCGACYLPIDPEYPHSRSDYMLKDSSCKILLISKNIEANPNFDGEILDISLDNSKIYTSTSIDIENNNIDLLDNQISFPIQIINTSNLNIHVSSNSNAYIMYTSGSTGVPKGTLVNHFNISRLVINSNYIDFKPSDKILQTGAIVFDAITFEMWGALLNGLELHLTPKNTLLDYKKLGNLLEKEKITIILLTSSLFTSLASNTIDIFKNLRYLLVGGDVLSAKHINLVKEKYPNINILNCYGPTENGVISTTFTIENIYKKSIPIGKPIANSTCYVLNKSKNLQPIGYIGELYVGGDGVGNGYLNNLTLNIENFIINPFNSSETLYKTGDLVRWLDNGNLEFIGRQDAQIKIRGYRVELEEIQNKICKHPAIKDCIVLCLKNADSKHLCAYIISYYVISISKIRQFLSEKLPLYMIPAYFIFIDKFPLTINGKIDKKSLPEPNFSNIIRDDIVLPQNTIQSELFLIFRKHTHIEEISISDNFFDLGGDSLSGINLIMDINNIFEIDLSIDDIFKYPSIELLSRHINTHANTNGYIIEKAPNMDFYPLSSAQKRMYLLTQINPFSIAYNTPFAIIFRDNINITKLQNTIYQVVNKHATLRTSFHMLDGEIVQKINNNINFNINYISINFKDNIKNELIKFVKPFNLSESPLFRVTLLNSDNTNILLIDLHHIITDGASLHILANDISKIYSNQSLSDTLIEYVDFSVWENNALKNNFFVQQEKFWSDMFNNDVPILNMPTDFIRPSTKSFEGNVYNNIINGSLYEDIKNFCAKNRITSYMFFLAAYYILLSKYSSQNDIVIGSPIAGRISDNLKDVFGMFVNTLPLKAHIDDKLSICDFILYIRELCVLAFKNQFYPLDEIVNKQNISRDSSRNPLFDVLFVYQNFGVPFLKFDNSDATILNIGSNSSKFDISLEVIPNLDKTYLINFEYATSLFKESTIINLCNNYITCIKNMVNSNSKIKDISIVSKTEKQCILETFNDTYLEISETETIYKLFEKQVAKTPNKVCLIFENKTLTFEQVNRLSNQLAYKLIKLGIGPNRIVGLMVNRSLEMIIGILAILKAGGCYLPIDPDYPPERIQYMLDDSKSPLILTQKHLNTTFSMKNYLNIDLDNHETYSGNDNNPSVKISSEDSSYVIYTSGSTGKPKGVNLKHKSLTNLTYYLNNYVEYLYDNLEHTCICVTTVSFDIFIFESLISLQRGIKIVIANEDEQRIPTLLDNALKKNCVDIIQTTPSRMQLWVDNYNSIPSLKNLKYITLAGEQFPDLLARKLKDICKCTLYNGYGPSETTVFSTFTDVTDYEKINIGKPLANTQIYILDNNLNICPIGIPGELYIGGHGVGKGYLYNDELTKEKFLQNPFIENSVIYKTGDIGKFLPNGEIECLGRSDNQIKIRGLRIELEEIEQVISKIPSISSCVVIDKKDVNNRQYLCGYFTSSKEINISDLRNVLLKELPKYMIPTHLIQIDYLPYTPNGKIDKKALPEPTLSVTMNTNTYIAPHSDIEIKLSSIFEKVLSIRPIGINDNFFELGGDSILAMNLQIALLKEGFSITYSDIFEYPTIKNLIIKLASLIEKNDTSINTEKSSNNKDFTTLKKLYNKYDNILSKNIIIPDTFKRKSSGNILLTGVTGFLGIHILDELLKQETGNIYCIIREKSFISPELRLKNCLKEYLNGQYINLINKRIFIIDGELSEINLGISSDNYISLSDNIDTIIHSAAFVSHFGNYIDFEKINVNSVKNLLDFSKKFNKKFFHISTLSVSGNTLVEQSFTENDFEESVEFNENTFYIGQTLKNVYAKSKFEAERLVLDSILDGTDSYILRLGNLTNRFSDGKFQTNYNTNAFLNRINSIWKIGCIPDYVHSLYLEFTPVDYCAKAIVSLCQYSNNTNKIFHLFNHNHIYIKEFIEIYNKHFENIKIVSEQDFIKIIENLLKNNNEILKGILNDFDKNHKLVYDSNIRIKSTFTINFLQRIGFSWPTITEDYILNFLKYIKKL